MPLILKNTFIAKTKYCGKSKFGFWNNIKPGMLIKVYTVIKPISRGQSGLHATTICFSHIDGSFSCGMNEAAKYLSKLELEEYK
jgi:hypothetical protein